MKDRKISRSYGAPNRFLSNPETYYPTNFQPFTLDRMIQVFRLLVVGHAIRRTFRGLIEKPADWSARRARLRRPVRRRGLLLLITAPNRADLPVAPGRREQ